MSTWAATYYLDEDYPRRSVFDLSLDLELHEARELSTRPAVTFPAKEINPPPLGQYHIILLGDRGTQV